MEIKWHVTVLDLITIPNSTFVLPQMLTDVGWWGWHFTGYFFEIT
jgi:hypothetical protein